MIVTHDTTCDTYFTLVPRSLTLDTCDTLTLVYTQVQSQQIVPPLLLQLFKDKLINNQGQISTHPSINDLDSCFDMESTQVIQVL